MNPRLNSVPGDIPGLLRRGSPLVYARWRDSRAVVGEAKAFQWKEDNGPWQPSDVWHLDLTDPTGRAHAAWCCGSAVLGGFRISDDESTQLDRARYGEDMTPAEIDTLARLILRLAGRSP